MFILRTKKAGVEVKKQQGLPLIYEDVKLDVGYRLDIIVENKVIIEIKAVEHINDVHLAQILTYLKLSDCKLGMLINFNVSLIKNGIKRVVDNLINNIKYNLAPFAKNFVPLAVKN